MTNRVVVLLSDDEFEAVKAKAGLVPLSAWFRALAVGNRPSKAVLHVETLRASDPMAPERPDVEYGSEELPSGGSVGAQSSSGNWREGRKRLLKPKERK